MKPSLAPSSSGRDDVLADEQVINSRSADATNDLQTTRFNQSQKFLLLLALALLIAMRLPKAWVNGRFQDEEATVFVAYAWHFPWHEALFRAFGGYLNIAANGITIVLAKLVQGGMLRLELAPYFTMSVGLAFQLLPACVLLWGRAPWLTSRLAVVAALLVLAIAPATEEVFLNVIHIQFQLALCAAIILSLDVPHRHLTRITYNAILTVAPLCGLGAVILLPLFGLRALIERDRQRLLQTVCLATAAAAQLLFFFAPNPVRAFSINVPELAASFFTRALAVPTVGPIVGQQLAGWIVHSRATDSYLLYGVAIFAVVLCVGLLLLSIRRKDGAIWLAASGMLIGAISISGIASLNSYDQFFPMQGPRYNFLPEVLMVLALVVIATRWGAQGKLATVLVGFTMLNGAIYYPQPIPVYSQGPSWADEVRAWRNNADHPLVVWPKPRAADLSGRTVRCRPVIPGKPMPGEPRYCEGAWISAFYEDPAIRHSPKR